VEARGLLIVIVFNLIIITLSSFLLITALSITWRGITPFCPCTVLRELLAQSLLHNPQGGRVMPCLGPPLSGGLIHVVLDLHPHDLKIWKDMDIREKQ
jgi:hypothetical protein